MRTELAALLDQADPVHAMSELACSWSRPAWAKTRADLAIGNYVARAVGTDRVLCVRAGLAALLRVAPLLPPDCEELAVSHAWLDEQIGALEVWLEDPSAENQRWTGGTYDATRQTSAWRDFDLVDAWIQETADFAIHAVWSGALAGYVQPPPPPSCAALAAVCATRAR
jgi:hypothetical protein